MAVYEIFLGHTDTLYHNHIYIIHMAFVKKVSNNRWITLQTYIIIFYVVVAAADDDDDDAENKRIAKKMKKKNNKFRTLHAEKQNDWDSKWHFIQSCYERIWFVHLFISPFACSSGRSF